MQNVKNYRISVNFWPVQRQLQSEEILVREIIDIDTNYTEDGSSDEENKEKKPTEDSKEKQNESSESSDSSDSDTDSD